MTNVLPYLNLSLSLSAQELRGLGYKKGKPLGLVGVTELSEDQKKQLKEQQEVLTSNYSRIEYVQFSN